MKRAAEIVCALVLTGCAAPDFSPQDIDFNQVNLTSSQGAYDLLLDAAYSAAVANELSTACDDFGFDAKEEGFARSFVEAEIEEFYEGDDAGLRAFVKRVTGDDSANLDESEGLSDEVKADLLRRIPAYFEARNLRGPDDQPSMCRAAETEKQAGSLIGRFLFRDG